MILCFVNKQDSLECEVEVHPAPNIADCKKLLYTCMRNNNADQAAHLVAARSVSLLFGT